MSWTLFTTFESTFSSLGIPMYLVGIVLLTALFIGFLILGLDVKYASAFVTPGIIGLSQVGWFPIWISTMAWIFIVGMGLFLLYNLLGSIN